MNIIQELLQITEAAKDHKVYKNKNEWLKAVKDAGATIEHDDRGMIATFGPGFRICGEWNDDPNMFGGVIYGENVEAYKKAKDKS